MNGTPFAYRLVVDMMQLRIDQIFWTMHFDSS
jgi:hypothetical protein